MPTKPSSPCRHPGCRAVVADGPYCEQHARKQAQQHATASRANWQQHQQDDPRYALAQRIRGTQQWRDISRQVLASNPVCCDPFRFHGIGRPVLSQTTHHVVPLIEAPERAYDVTNLAPCCTQCHARVEAMERAGQRSDHLFDGAAVASPFGPVLLVGRKSAVPSSAGHQGTPALVDAGGGIESLQP